MVCNAVGGFAVPVAPAVEMGLADLIASEIAWDNCRISGERVVGLAADDVGVGGRCGVLQGIG